MKRTVYITLILPKDQLTAREREPPRLCTGIEDVSVCG